MPPCLRTDVKASDKKQLFVAPSDMMFRESSSSEGDYGLSLPVSRFELEMKEVLEKFMND